MFERFLVRIKARFCTCYLFYVKPRGKTVCKSRWMSFSFILPTAVCDIANFYKMLFCKLWSIVKSSFAFCPPWIGNTGTLRLAFRSKLVFCDGSSKFSGSAYTIYPFWMKSAILEPLLRLKPFASSSLATT